MLSFLKALIRLFSNSAVVLPGILAASLAAEAFAADSIETLRIFGANELPSTREIREDYINFTYRPLKKEELSFNILIPSGDWRDIPVTISSEMIGQDTSRLITLAKQMAPENEKGEAKIEVVYTRVDLEIGLCGAVDLYLWNNRNSFRVLMRRQGVFNERKVEDVLLKSEQDAGKYLARMTFSRHGERIFMVSCSALEPEFARFAKDFATAAVSFHVHGKSPAPYAEKMAVFSSGTVPWLEFKHPESWTVEELGPSPPGQASVDIKLVVEDQEGQGGTTHGYIHASAFAKRTGRAPAQALAFVKKGFQEMGLSLESKTLQADIMPERDAPFGKLERWNTALDGISCEAAFLVAPDGNDIVALGLLSVRPEDNMLSWLHTWRVFEIIASDLTGNPIELTKLKNRCMPSDSELKTMAADSMAAFKNAVQNREFANFFAAFSNTFKAQATPATLENAFGGFSDQEELDQLEQKSVVLEEGVCLDKEGLLKIDGHCPTRPEEIAFKLTYVQEQDHWKLLGIHVAMKEPPQAAASETQGMAPRSDSRSSKGLNVLAAENGCRVLSCSSQYNATSWGARNLIDGQLGPKHGDVFEQNTD